MGGDTLVDHLAGTLSNRSEVSRFVHWLTIDNFAGTLTSEAPPSKRATLRKLLIDEEDRFGVGQEQLAHVDARISNGQTVIENQRALIMRLSEGGKDLREAQKLLMRLMEVQWLFVSRRQQILDRLNQNAFGGPGIRADIRHL
jgi:hypothetical protein